MPAIVALPQVVEELLLQFGNVFPKTPTCRRSLCRVPHRLVRRRAQDRPGIHREFADHPTSPASTASSPSAWEPKALNDRRLELLQKDPSTRYSDQGVIPIDNTLIDHDGMLIPDAGWFWDHAEERNKIAQDYLFVNYVCTSGKHYPLEFRLFRKQENCMSPAVPQPYHLVRVLIDWVCEGIPGDFTFDCYFTMPRCSTTSSGEQPQLCGRPEDQPCDHGSGQDTTASAWLATLGPLGARR